ncbi:MAG: zinc-dependent peptidase, partial [Lysobacter sp.]|nr:zinc-dependent peptidase [Lysobacter sp.]
ALLDAVDDDPDLVLSEDEQAGYLHGIRTTAADAPEEFFAVVSECHFSNPGALLARMPQVAAHLTRFYGPSPFA